MIFRVYRCTVIAGKEAEHRAVAFKKGHPLLAKNPGLIASMLASLFRVAMIEHGVWFKFGRAFQRLKPLAESYERTTVSGTSA